ncbi:small lysine-rich protein 1 [Xylocopa sonorina]|uniref:small lysine-rich protein 1 n=1 Tax=Xylocopa sonorina TaxID=1818115 RepID=UPI00403B2F2A
MRGKGKKKMAKNNGKNEKAKNSKNGKNSNGGKNKGTKRSRKSGGRAKFSMDIFNEEAMENAYYTCHNIMDVLRCRGFPWPEAQKKKKKKKGRK